MACVDAEVNKIEAENDHQITLARIDNLQVVVDLMDDIQKKEKEHQEAILGYVQKEKKLETEKEMALRDNQIASGLQHNSLEESKTLAKGAKELRLKCSNLQHSKFPAFRLLSRCGFVSGFRQQSSAGSG